MEFDREEYVGKLVFHQFLGNGCIIGGDSLGGFNIQFDLFPERSIWIHKKVHHFEMGLSEKKENAWLQSLSEPLQTLWRDLVCWETYMEYAIDECMGEFEEFEHEVYQRECLAEALHRYQQVYGEPSAQWYTELARIDQRFIDHTVPSFNGRSLLSANDPEIFWYYFRFPKICQKDIEKLSEGQIFAPDSMGCFYCSSSIHDE